MQLGLALFANDRGNVGFRSGLCSAMVVLCILVRFTLDRVWNVALLQHLGAILWVQLAHLLNELGLAHSATTSAECETKVIVIFIGTFLLLLAVRSTLSIGGGCFGVRWNAHVCTHSLETLHSTTGRFDHRGAASCTWSLFLGLRWNVVLLYDLSILILNNNGVTKLVGKGWAAFVLGLLWFWLCDNVAVFVMVMPGKALHALLPSLLRVLSCILPLRRF